MGATGGRPGGGCGSTPAKDGASGSNARRWGRRLGATALALGLAATTAACEPDIPGANSDGRTVIVAGLYPLGWAAEQAGGDLVTVEVLVPAGTEPHEYELTPQQVAQVASASIVIYQQGITPALDEAIAQNRSATAKTIDTATLVEPLLVGGTQDPHTWLDPINMMNFVEVVREALVALNPVNEPVYSNNAREATVLVAGLDTAYLGGLAECERDTFIASHAAFGYLAREYGLTQVSIAGLTPEDEPTPAHLAEVEQTAKDEQVTTIFYDPLEGEYYATALATDLGLKTAVLDAIETLSEKSAGADYPAIMRANLEALREANGCK